MPSFLDFVLVTDPIASIASSLAIEQMCAKRQRPNLLITGTPGVGKTTFCEALASRSGLQHVEVSKLVREKRLYREWDDELDCSIFDEEMVQDALEPLLERGGCLLDFHSSSFLDENDFDLVIVLRADTSVLYDRLEKRHYPESKIKQNVEAEIFQSCLDEAQEAFEETTVSIWELQHDTEEHMEDALERAQPSPQHANCLHCSAIPDTLDTPTVSTEGVCVKVHLVIASRQEGCTSCQKSKWQKHRALQEKLSLILFCLLSCVCVSVFFSFLFCFSLLFLGKLTRSINECVLLSSCRCPCQAGRHCRPLAACLNRTNHIKG
ncbi:unnamed protein product [Effrenium voratum]|uniref:Adenylate kinase isoenzyme 6 homolog n=1 Tax=Effrenium voratum TaxID=2562239 RepID=A0AA36I8F7_9DINO|nr:unnamed protein product [Effrenium voratum]